LGSAFPASTPDTQFAYSYGANPADLPMEAGSAYNVMLRLDNGQTLALSDQQVREGETRLVKVKLSDFK